MVTDTTAEESYAHERGHALRRVEAAGEWGSPTWEYRGARIETGGPKAPTVNFLRLPGHPYDGKQHGQMLMCMRMVDEWLDHQRLPAPYVWPSQKTRRQEGQ